MIWNKLFGKKETIVPSDNNGDNSSDNLSVADIVNNDIPPVHSDISAHNEHENATDLQLKDLQLKDLQLKDLPPIFKFDDDELSPVTDTAPKKSALSGFISGLRQTKNALSEKITAQFTHKKLSLDMLDDLEDLLIQSDVGVKTAMMLRQKLETERFDKETDVQDIKDFLSREISLLLKPVQQLMTIKRQAKPYVITFVGVNGSGKTTTIGKMAHRFKQAGLSVMLAAGDTYRAAATEQLVIWGQRNDVPVIASTQGSDAASLVYNAYAQAQDAGADILLVDTAGRLQNKNNLMQELLKISRVLQKYDMDLPHETILVLDATTGQNAISQAEIFRDIANISGIIMTKLDGSAKGGVLVGIGHILKLPIYAVGMGEKIQDLQPFDADAFARAITDTV